MGAHRCGWVSASRRPAPACCTDSRPGCSTTPHGWRRRARRDRARSRLHLRRARRPPWEESTRISARIIASRSGTYSTQPLVSCFARRVYASSTSLPTSRGRLGASARNPRDPGRGGPASCSPSGIPRRRATNAPISGSAVTAISSRDPTVGPRYSPTTSVSWTMARSLRPPNGCLEGRLYCLPSRSLHWGARDPLQVREECAALGRWGGEGTLRLGRRQRAAFA